MQQLKNLQISTSRFTIPFLHLVAHRKVTMSTMTPTCETADIFTKIDNGQANKSVFAERKNSILRTGRTSVL